jgi:hypothetical protein
MAYDAVNISKGQRKIVEFLMRHPGKDFTRAEIAAFAPLSINSVCGRVFELRKAGIVEELPRRECRLSREQAHSIRLVPAQTTLELAA